MMHMVHYLFEVICLCIYISCVVQNSQQNRHLCESYLRQATNTGYRSC